MKPGKSVSRRRKIILYYVTAVVLPGIVLGYMAFRGIRNDQALREKESLRKLETNSLTFFSEIDSDLERFMDEQTSDSVLSGSKRTDPSILVLYIENATGSRKLISHQMLYLPADLINAGFVKSHPSASLREGQRMEFAEQRLSDALRFYQEKSQKTTDTEIKIQALVASARLYNKLNQPERAKALYNEMWKDYPGNLLNGQIPVGLIAGLEILKIDHNMGENDEMKYNSRHCLELLLHPTSEYGSDQFEMFYKSFQEIIRGTNQVIDSLFREIDVQRARTDNLIRIITKSDPDFTSGNNYFNDSRNGITCKPINSAELSAVYLTWDKNNDLTTGMVIDFPAYLKYVSDKLIKKLDPDSSINVKIEDNNGRLIFSKVLKEETGYLSFPFSGNLPGYKLLLSESKPDFIATLLKAGSGIYLFAFILIALLMSLGFVFTIYSLNVELRLNKLKSEFISNVSHELKSPLTSIRMMTEMLHHNRVETEERKSAYFSAMLEESEHLSHLIDNILDFSRMEDDRKKYDFIDLDINELLLKFLESIRKRPPEPGFDIRYNCPARVPEIKGDKDAILQVFYNLVDNALKFSGTSRQIDINLFSKDDELLFCVKDYGLGISSKDQEKIFERFYRGDEPQRKEIKGSGIGLTIVKKIVEAHKGYMTLESKPGEGSTFCVHLPVK